MRTTVGVHFIIIFFFTSNSYLEVLLIRIQQCQHYLHLHLHLHLPLTTTSPPANHQQWLLPVKHLWTTKSLKRAQTTKSFGLLVFFIYVFSTNVLKTYFPGSIVVTWASNILSRCSCSQVRVLAWA